MATARVVRACLSTLALVLLTGRVAAQAPVRKGQWVQLPKTGQLWKLSQQSLAFPRNDNLKYCWMRTITIMKDGRRDYEPEINAKLAYLNSMGGGTVKLGPGVFPHIKQIAMPSYTCLRGSGIDRTYLRLVNNAPRFRYSGSIRSFHTERITITDLTQDGNRGNQGLDKRRNYGRYGLFTELTNFLYLKNVRVKNNWAYGFDPHGKFYSTLFVLCCPTLSNALLLTCNHRLESALELLPDHGGLQGGGQWARRVHDRPDRVCNDPSRLQCEQRSSRLQHCNRHANGSVP